MYFIYLLHNKLDKFYIGSTGNLKKRVEQHNQGYVKSTKTGIPWNLVYFEGYSLEEHAKDREEQLEQHGKGLATIKKRIGLSIK